MKVLGTWCQSERSLSVQSEHGRVVLVTSAVPHVREVVPSMGIELAPDMALAVCELLKGAARDARK